MTPSPTMSENRKHIVFSLKLSAVLIGVPLLLTLARTEGLISKEFVDRCIGALIGVVSAVYGNSIPKLLGSAPASISEARKTQTLRRISGWALTIGFLISAALWIFASFDVAQIGTIASVGCAGLVVAGFAAWKCMTSDKSEKQICR